MLNKTRMKKMITIVATISLFASFGLAHGAWSGWSDGWEISESHSSESTGYEYGNWSHSEHFIITPGRPDEGWTYANSTDWEVVSNIAWWPGNDTFEINTTGINSSFAVLNESGMNRSQAFGWVHVNYTSTDAIAPFLIFAYENASSFDCVLWSSTEAWICHWNGTNMTDMDTGDAVVDPSTDAADLSNQWVQEGVYITDQGNFFKYIYNELEGRLQFKWWDGSAPMYEPTGWCIDTNHTNITHTTNRSHGVGFWNYDGISSRIQFDLLNYWQLNYTVNTSDYMNITGTNTSRAHMDFPVIDIGDWTEELMGYFNDSELENITGDDVRSIMKDNITNLLNLESRSFRMDAVDAYKQNDTVYYYSCAIDNFTAFFPEEYDDWLHLHVQMCPEGGNIDTTEYADMLVGIDVDNNRAWDTNDRLYWAYANSTMDVTLITYNGDGFQKANIADADIWLTNRTAPGNLHRYGPQLNYVLHIPFADLIKDDITQLNSSDLFGLCILTTTAGNPWGEPCVWNNWNETSGQPITTEYGSINDIIGTFFNGTEEETWPVNSTCLAAWGEGEIGEGLDLDEESGADVNITKTADVTTYTVKGGTKFEVTYDIWVNNTGSGALTTVVVNDTLFNCSCHTWSESDFTCNIDWGNITNQSCHRLFTNDSIGEGESWHIQYTINLTICDEDDETGTITNTASVNATELGTAETDSHSITWNTKTNIDNAVDLISGDFLVMFVILAILGMMVAFLTGALKIK